MVRVGDKNSHLWTGMPAGGNPALAGGGIRADCRGWRRTDGYLRVEGLVAPLRSRNFQLDAGSRLAESRLERIRLRNQISSIYGITYRLDGSDFPEVLGRELS